MSVDTTHPQYDAFKDIWRKTRDAVVGEPAIKKGRELYLPADFAESEPDRYNTYLGRAYFMGVTGQTQKSTIGMIFRKPFNYEGPSDIEGRFENIDGANTTLTQLSKYACQEAQEARIGIMAEYPPTEAGLTKAEEKALGVEPYLKTYTAESIINWKEEDSRLVMVVLKEMIEDPMNMDEFTHNMVPQYRVLRLTDGVYTQQLYDDGLVGGEVITPRQGGKTIDHIPFYLADSENTDSNCSMPMLYDIATVNISHYQNTADSEEASFLCGQPHVHVNIGETDEELWKAQNPNGLKFGSRSGTITRNGSVELVQANESSMPLTLIERKENQMRALGARLVQSQGANETATASRIEASGQTSALDALVKNVSSAITKGLQDMARFKGASDDLKFELNNDFFEESLDAQTISAITGLQAVGTIAKNDARHMLRMGRLEIKEGRTNEDIDADNANDMLNEPAIVPIE